MSTLNGTFISSMKMDDQMQLFFQNKQQQQQQGQTTE